LIELIYQERFSALEWYPSNYNLTGQQNNKLVTNWLVSLYRAILTLLSHFIERLVRSEHCRTLPNKSGQSIKTVENLLTKSCVTLLRTSFLYLWWRQ